MRPPSRYYVLEVVLRSAMEGMRETLGARHPHTLDAIRNFGSLLQAKGDLGASRRILREVK